LQIFFGRPKLIFVICNTIPEIPEHVSQTPRAPEIQRTPGGGENDLLCIEGASTPQGSVVPMSFNLYHVAGLFPSIFRWSFEKDVTLTQFSCSGPLSTGANRFHFFSFHEQMNSKSMRS